MAPQDTSATADSSGRQAEAGSHDASELFLVQTFPLPTIPLSPPACTKRKRRPDFDPGADDPEDVRSSKKSRSTPSLEVEFSEKPWQEHPGAGPNDAGGHSAEVQELPPQPPHVQTSPSSPAPISQQTGARLTEKNLRLLNGDMEGPAKSKRTLSRLSRVSSSEAESFRSQRSSSTAAHYRYKHLKAALVYIHVDPSEDIHATINDIINAKPAEDHHAILRNMAGKFQRGCQKLVQFAAGENDFVYLFRTIVQEIMPDKVLCCENADWRAELKPTIQKLDVHLSFLFDGNATGGGEQQDIHNASAPSPPKRHQQSAGRLYISPRPTQTSSSDARPASRLPELDQAQEKSLIKTPRPDITIGIEGSALVSALVSSLSSPEFDRFTMETILEQLQDLTIPSEPDGRQEQALIIEPTQRKTTLTFPTLLFEAKAYSTGKQVFEAQNQAAVSGAAGLKMQLMLDELVQRVTSSSDIPLTPSHNPPPLVFSICTEGPYHELWAHYTVVEDGRRLFNMVLLDTCHGVVVKQVERFLVQVHNILMWTKGHFLSTVVERLAAVARRATAGVEGHGGW